MSAMPADGGCHRFASNVKSRPRRGFPVVCGIALAHEVTRRVHCHYNRIWLTRRHCLPYGVCVSPRIEPAQKWEAFAAKTRKTVLLRHGRAPRRIRAKARMAALDRRARCAAVTARRIHVTRDLNERVKRTARLHCVAVMLDCQHITKTTVTIACRRVNTGCPCQTRLLDKRRIDTGNLSSFLGCVLFEGFGVYFPDWTCRVLGAIFERNREPRPTAQGRS